ncbi:MAG: iron chelate uptake ABC transporter family permease subunit [Pseudomonadota bacterium]
MARYALPSLFIVNLILCGLFLFWALPQPAGFILSLRGTKLFALLLVGAATGMATVIFQTITQNRLLTPGIVGFDALFVLIQTLLVLFLGGAAVAQLPSHLVFLVEAVFLLGAALALFGIVLRKGAHDILRLVLTGVICGVLLRGLAGFAQRVMEPSEFAVVQQAMFASFNAVPMGQLIFSTLILGLTAAACWALASQLDLASLGRTKATSLGLRYDRLVFIALALVSLLVAVSTALVGPIIFLGLLAASLAHAITKSHRHAVLLPAAAFIGASILVVGQFIFERLLGLQSTLAVIIEFFGGLLFLMLVLRRRENDRYS